MSVSIRRTTAELCAAPGDPASPFGPGGPVSPFAPAGPASPFGPGGPVLPRGTWPVLKSWASSDPLRTWRVPTLLFGSVTAAHETPPSAMKSASVLTMLP